MLHIFDDYVTQVLDLVPLDVPPKFLFDDRDADAMEILGQAIKFEANYPSSPFGSGKVALAVHPRDKKILYAAASLKMVQQGLSKTALLDRDTTWEECENKPTHAGFASCMYRLYMETVWGL